MHQYRHDSVHRYMTLTAMAVQSTILQIHSMSAAPYHTSPWSEATECKRYAERWRCAIREHSVSCCKKAIREVSQNLSPSQAPVQTTALHKQLCTNSVTYHLSASALSRHLGPVHRWSAFHVRGCTSCRHILLPAAVFLLLRLYSLLQSVNLYNFPRCIWPCIHYHMQHKTQSTATWRPCITWCPATTSIAKYRAMHWYVHAFDQSIAVLLPGRESLSAVQMYVTR